MTVFSGLGIGEGNFIVNKASLEQDFKETEKISGHAMVTVGYNDDLNAFLIMNSWKDWGGKIYGAPAGCFWMNYDALDAKYGSFFQSQIVNFIAVLGIENDGKILSKNESLIYEYSGFDKYGYIRYCYSNMKVH